MMYRFRKKEHDFNAISFPCKLYAMLEDAERCGFDHVIHWQSGGKSFKVSKPEIFANEIMAGYFAQTKFKSFQRQLNIYGWKKIHHGPDKGGYVHRFFLRGKPDLCHRIVRRTSKDLNIPVDHSDLAMDPLTLVFQGERLIMSPSSAQGSHDERRRPLSGEQEDYGEIFCDFYSTSHSANHGRQTTPAVGYHGRRTSLDYAVSGHFRINTEDLELKFDADELDGLVSILNNHEEHRQPPTFGRLLPPPLHPLAAREPAVEEEELEHIESNAENDEPDELDKEHSFPFKLHLMLESAERDNYSHVVSWVKGGKAFKVFNNKEFVSRVLPIYFDQSKYESFRRQLNLYCFQRVARGADRGIISHPFFVAGKRDLCRDIKRKQQGKSFMLDHQRSQGLAIVT